MELIFHQEARAAHQTHMAGALGLELLVALEARLGASSVVVTVTAGDLEAQKVQFDSCTLDLRILCPSSQSLCCRTHRQGRTWHLAHKHLKPRLAMTGTNYCTASKAGLSGLAVEGMPWLWAREVRDTSFPAIARSGGWQPRSGRMQGGHTKSHCEMSICIRTRQTARKDARAIRSHNAQTHLQINFFCTLFDRVFRAKE